MSPASIFCASLCMQFMQSGSCAPDSTVIVPLVGVSCTSYVTLRMPSMRWPVVSVSVHTEPTCCVVRPYHVPVTLYVPAGGGCIDV